MNKNNPRPFNIVSSLFEELTHIMIYVKKWQRKNYVRSTPDRFGCDTSFYNSANRFHDEYVANRYKAHVINTTQLIEFNGERTVGQLQYYAEILPLLRTAEKELRKIIIGVTDGVYPIAGAAEDALNLIHRYIFDPLARNAAFTAGHGVANDLNLNLDRSSFYKLHIKQFWEQIQNQMETSFESGLAKETDIALEKIVGILKNFLKYIGVSCSTKADGGCRTEIETTFFDNYHPE